MKTITINAARIRISEPELRGLRAIQAGGFVSLEGDLYERRRGGYGTSLLPYSQDYPQWELLGLHRISRASITYRGAGFPGAQLKRVQEFFRQHPRARIAIVGNPRRINAILRKVDAAKSRSTQAPTCG
jgi:hypothetical protein